MQGQPQIRHMTCSTEPYGVTASFGLHNKPVNAMWEFSKVTLSTQRHEPCVKECYSFPLFHVDMLLDNDSSDCVVELPRTV